ncbi:HD domain-containing phosphohydrolase [Oscillatoria sp. FACHB-1406]|uniref:response regulator n=1 Tax=Oscillatoria sp. FACHB-1406 TaxID=2692846 RepID=UPI001F5514BD|nr:HD domain-containing phosphohydrolase [Oscillatoria sp. FACHB-1406]
MSARSDSQPEKILVVDDSLLTRSLTIDLLSAAGYEAIEAENGAIALEIARHDRPDAVLLDVLMPNMDGYEVCRRLKQDPQTQEIPVIFITVSDDRRARLQGIEAGGDDFLTKPIDRLELSARIKNWIRHKRLSEDISQTEHILFTIAKAVEQRYSSTDDPLERLIDLARAFGEYLQLSEEEIHNLVSAANLHDIGAVAIPDAVLLKQGKLTPEETDLIRQHVSIGEALCKPLRNLRGVLPIVRHHHERWDGSGYPDGLVGDEIPKLAQVFQTIDIYDALTRQRPYKQAVTPAQALEILRRETQRGWRNPELVAQFCEFAKNWDRN